MLFARVPDPHWRHVFRQTARILYSKAVEVTRLLRCIDEAANRRQTQGALPMRRANATDSLSLKVGLVTQLRADLFS